MREVETEQLVVSTVDSVAAAAVDVAYFQLLISLYAFLQQHSMQKHHHSLIAGVIGGYYWSQMSQAFAVLSFAVFAVAVSFAICCVARTKPVDCLQQPTLPPQIPQMMTTRHLQHHHHYLYSILPTLESFLHYAV